MPKSGLDKLRNERDKYVVESQSLLYVTPAETFWDDDEEEAPDR